MDHIMWKSMKNCAWKCRQKLCAFFSVATWAFEKMCVCFLDEWPQTKCKVTCDTRFLYRPKTANFKDSEWKSIKSWIRNRCQKLPCILFGATYQENKQLYTILASSVRVDTLKIKIETRVLWIVVWRVEESRVTWTEFYFGWKFNQLVTLIMGAACIDETIDACVFGKLC